MAHTEPLGLPSMSMVGSPAAFTYCVAICPAFASVRTVSISAMKRPSPWEMGAMWMSPTRACISHGESVEATRVRTMRDWWRPMTLNVSVGAPASGSRISP